MLQLYKNEVVAEVSVRQADVRQQELSFYTRNYWTWGSTCTIFAGFVFSQLTRSGGLTSGVDGPGILLENFYLICVSGCLGSSICVIIWTVLMSMWGPGLALRGPAGMASFHAAVTFLKSQQALVYQLFQLSIVLYLLSAVACLWVFPSSAKVNLVCTVVFALVLLCSKLFELLLHRKLRGFGANAGEEDLLGHGVGRADTHGFAGDGGNDGQIHSLDGLMGVADLDTASMNAQQERQFYGTGSWGGAAVPLATGAGAGPFGTGVLGTGAGAMGRSPRDVMGTGGFADVGLGVGGGGTAQQSRGGGWLW